MKYLISYFSILISFISFAQNVPVTRTQSYDETERTGSYDSDSERILEYNVTIYVQNNSNLNVTELIKVNSIGNNITRGIYRTLPIKRNLNKQTYPIKYTNIAVKRDGVTDKFHEETTTDWLKLYIGKEDVFLDPGVYTYEITYTVNKQIGFFDTYDELYWNATGTEWIFPIDKTIVTVNLPDQANIIQNACYTGVFGSTATNCSATEINSTTIRWIAENLDSHEGLTVAVGFKKGIILPPPPPSFLERYGIAIFLFLAFIALAIYAYFLWSKYGVDPPKPTVVPQFYPPNNLSPASLSFYRLEKIKKNSITASLTNLAVKKYIVIEEINKKRYFGLSGSKTFHLIKNANSNLTVLPEEERIVMEFLFGKSNTITINGTFNKRVSNALLHYKKSINEQFKSMIKTEKNSSKLLKLNILFLFTFLASLLLSSYIEGNTSVINLSVYLLISMGIPLIIYYFTRSSNKIIVKGCLRPFISFLVFGNTLVSIGIVIYTTFNKLETFAIQSCIIFFVVGIIGLLVMRYLIKKPTVEKLQVQADIEGFKMYMSAAENEQIKFHNAPQFTPEIFEKYLPYAMVFGVDAIWGKKFNELIQNSSLEYEPSWYVGSSFNSITIGAILGSQLTNSFHSSSIQPSERSGSSFGGGSSSSGSSGGGSSGGGGGGGGGGGW